MLVPLRLEPGFSSVGTPYDTGVRWHDGNLVRWHEGVMRPVGGWTRLSPTQMQGKARAIYSWRTNDFLRRLVIGTTKKLYAYADGSLYDITPAGLAEGREDSVYGFGYGSRTYGTTSYGTPRPQDLSAVATSWSFANFGELLVAVQDYDGRLWQWDNNVNNVLTLVPNAPNHLLGVHVSPERHLMAIGANGDKRQIAWASAETLDVWAPSATNSAGFLNLSTNERIVTWTQYRNVLLVLTESEAHAVRYVGYPFIYGAEKIASGCGAVGLHALAPLNNLVAWMGPEGFYVFDGVIRYLPCPVHDHVFRDFNRRQKEKVYASRNRRFNEVWWFYPSENSLENDRYVVWNYADNIWYTGYLGRAAMEDSGVFDTPLAVTHDGWLYQHETGWAADGSPLTSQRWAKSGLVEAQDGNVLTFVRRLVPDRDPGSAVGFRLYTRTWPESPEVAGPLLAGSPRMDFRLTGRHVAVELVGLQDADWRVGKLRLDVVPAGGR